MARSQTNLKVDVGGVLTSDSTWPHGVKWASPDGDKAAHTALGQRCPECEAKDGGES